MTQVARELNVEKRAMSMFRQDLAKDFKRLTVILVYGKIKSEPDISELTLKKFMRMEHNIPAPIVDGALSSLISQAGFSAVKTWYYSNNKSVMRYAVRNEAIIEAWIQEVLETKPEWQGHVNAIIR